MPTTPLPKRTSRELWNDQAALMFDGRDDLWRCSRPVSEWMVRALDPERGSTILELAAGIGETGFLAARWIGPTGTLLTTDFAPAVVESARRRAAELGLTNAVCRVMDAEAPDLPDDSVDGVLCRWGYMVMEHPATALRETRRVLRTGGRFAFSVFAAQEHNPWAGAVSTVLRRRGLVRPGRPGDPGLFALSDPDRLAAMIIGAGFAEPAIAPMSLRWEFATPDAWWQFISRATGTLAGVFADLAATDLALVRAAALMAAEPWGTPAGGLSFPVLVLNGVTW